MTQPVRFALWLAFGYFCFGMAYILFSGDLAAEYATSLEHLRQIEQIKGAVFIVVTTLLLFLFAFLLLRRQARNERILNDYRVSLLNLNRRATAGLFASSVAHDINNVLVVIESVTEDVGEADEKERAVLIGFLATATQNLKELSRRLATARDGLSEGEVRVFDLAAAVREIQELVGSHKKARSCRFGFEAGKRTWHFHGYRAHFNQMMLNLLLNAAEATEGAGRVEVRLRSGDGEIWIEVHDNGPGVPEESRERIMEPLNTTKEDGCGLGLLSVRTCAEQHGGSVEVTDSEALGGACFRVRLPVAGPGKPVAESGGDHAPKVENSFSG